ncbi:hypothetical protein I314_05981 [Cryptococcus bacillisporus CA1873]|uniref:Uncharacterized protein n=2 Tax=Cryptococcus gattii TaxID=552467 RepID=A0A0D0TH59_CRYGA|nr:hypothetical protein I312_05134 [Cryptococcus bacillisporus CA1280]KIR58355.1 hypothetical protein I314_05981 [Cryptococcus bacillisporus CA1873]|eukprot:KIR58355.1 hypothetical protein I314_05981 [Cryptococcus gattii CA1873]
MIHLLHLVITHFPTTPRYLHRPIAIMVTLLSLLKPKSNPKPGVNNLYRYPILILIPIPKHNFISHPSPHSALPPPLAQPSRPDRLSNTPMVLSSLASLVVPDTWAPQPALNG